jgi:hypothetical protein
MPAWILPQVVAGCQDGSVVLVDVAAGCQLARWKAHTAAVHSLTWVDAAQHSQQASPQPQEQEQQQQQQQRQQMSPSHYGYLVSVGADRRLKLWQVPRLGTPQQPLQQQDQQQQAPAAPAGAAATAAVAEEAESPASACTQPAAKPTGVSLVTADAVADRQPGPVVLQLQPLSAAAVDPCPPGSGPKQQQYYGAATVVPGSVQRDGSCVVLCGGVNGRLGATALVPGGRAWGGVLLVRAAATMLSAPRTSPAEACS